MQRPFDDILRGPEFQRRMTTPELHFLLGKRLYEIERALGVKEPSLLSTAYRNGVPIFVGAVQEYQSGAFGAKPAIGGQLVSFTTPVFIFTTEPHSVCGNTPGV